MSETNAASTARREQLRRARAGRVARVRRRVAAASLVSFAIAWGVIAGAGSQGAATTTTTASTSAAASTSGTSTSTSTATGARSSDPTTATPSAVTTRQS
jgi:hypothetical protein